MIHETQRLEIGRLTTLVSRYRSALESIAVLDVDYTDGPDGNLERAREIARQALVERAPDLAAEVLALRAEVARLRKARRSSAVEIARRAARAIGDSDGV